MSFDRLGYAASLEHSPILRLGTVSLDSSAYNRRRLAREPHLYSPEVAARFNRICDLNGVNAMAEVMVVV